MMNKPESHPPSEDAMAQLHEDHWAMAVLFQRISEGLAAGMDNGLLVRMLKLLVGSLEEHALREEEYLIAIHHPSFEKHRAEHVCGKKVLAMVVDACDAGEPVSPAMIATVSAVFTDLLFAGDRRDGLSLH